MRPRTLFSCFILALVGCVTEDESTMSTADALSCAKLGDPHCEHVIDRVIVPKLRALGLAPRDGDPAVVCRRMAIDLIGRVPTLAELDRCIGQPTLGERAEAFIAMPEYVLLQQRGWAETLRFNSDLMWYGDAVELDRLAGRLYTGELDYAAFATSVVTFPGFYALHQGDDWAATVIHVFLGRTARSDELAGIRPLTRMFASRTFCDGAIWTATYDGAIEDGLSPADAKDDADETCIDSDTEEYAIDFCGCARGEGSVGCRSTTLGTTIDLGAEGCRDPGNPSAHANLYRTNDTFVAGKRTTCTTEAGTTKPCKDRLVNDDDEVTTDLRPIALADGAMRQRLGKIGGALAARADFWEAAADRELGRLIGWWKDGVRRPDFDLPEVRTLLANELRASGSLRAVQKLIVTSLLYAAPAEPPSALAPGVQAPVWSMGSTKILTAESWLDSAGIATFGKPLGACDHRFMTVGESTPPYNVEASLFRRVKGPLPAFTGDGYYASAQLLGGCTADQPRPRSSTVGMTYAHHDMARTLCAKSPAILPPAFSPSDRSEPALKKAADHVVRRALSRVATAEEAGLFVTEMKECLDAANGCRSPEAAVRWLCTRVIDSAEFALY